MNKSTRHNLRQIFNTFIKNAEAREEARRKPKKSVKEEGKGFIRNIRHIGKNGLI